VPFSLSALSVLARASGRENRLVHIRIDFDRNKGEHGFFDCTDQITNRFLLFPALENSISSDSLHQLHQFICVVSLFTSFQETRRI
jgi:hypothetical protein